MEPDEQHCMICHHQFVCELRRNTNLSASTLGWFCRLFFYSGPSKDPPIAIDPNAPTNEDER